MTYTDEEGVAAIKYLQGLASIPETDEQAERGWRRMTPHEREFTINFYRQMVAERDPAETAQQLIASSPEAQRRVTRGLDRSE